MDKQLLFSVTSKDFKVEHFTVGGNGGSGKDTSNTGVRITHPDSGAKGECREERSQLQNKKKAFARLVASTTFKKWHKLEVAKHTGAVARAVEETRKAMNEKNLKVECKDENGRWINYEE